MRFLYSLNNIWNYVIIFAFGVIALLLIYPLFSIFLSSFIDNDSGIFTFQNYSEILGRRYYRKAIYNSVVVGIAGMVGALIIGIPLAYFTTRFQIRGKSLITTLAILALVSPPFIGAYAWITMLGSNGWLRHLLQDLGILIPTIYGPLGIVLVFSLKFYPFVFLLTSGALSTINVSLEDAADNLGCNPITKFIRVTLPLVFPAVSAGAILAFVLSLADFGTPSIIGRNYRVLSTLAYNLYTSEMGGNPGLASTVSIILIIISLIFVYFQRKLNKKKDYGSSLLHRPIVKKLNKIYSVPVHFLCYFLVLFSSIPAIVVIFNSFRNTSGPVFKPGFGFDSYRRIIGDVPEAILNSFMFSIASVAMVVVLGTLIGYVIARKQSIVTDVLDSMIMVPYIVPGIVLGLGLIVSYNSKPLVLVGTAFIIILAIFIRRLPYSVRSSASILKQIRTGVEEAAINLGTIPSKAFLKITLPLMMPGVVAGALMAFVTAINELSSSIILYVGGTVTMPVRIYLSVLDGEFGTAAALSSILLITTGLAVYAVLSVSESKENAFI